MGSNPSPCITPFRRIDTGGSLLSRNPSRIKNPIRSKPYDIVPGWAVRKLMDTFWSWDKATVMEDVMVDPTTLRMVIVALFLARVMRPAAFAFVCVGGELLPLGPPLPR